MCFSKPNNTTFTADHACPDPITFYPKSYRDLDSWVFLNCKNKWYVKNDYDLGYCPEANL